MLDQELHQATLEFARALRYSPAVAVYRATKEALDADKGAQALLADMGEQQATLKRMQVSGLSPTQLQIDALRHSQAAIRANEIVMAHLRATTEVKAFLPIVGRYISASLGFDFAQLVAPSC